jgi:hypothetical protein
MFMRKNKYTNTSIYIFIFFLLFVSTRDIFSQEIEGLSVKREQIKASLAKEHADRVNQIKQMLPSLLDDLKQGNDYQREEAAATLAFSEDTSSIMPLIACLSDSSSSVKRTVINSLMLLAYRGDNIPQFNEFLTMEIMPAFKKILEDENESVRTAAAIALYRLGEKDIAFPVLESLAKAGNVGIPGAFIYIPEFSRENMLVNVVLLDRQLDPFSKAKKIVDKDAYPFLLELLDSSGSSAVRIKTAEIMYNYNIADGEYLLPYLREISMDADDLDSSTKAMSLLYKIASPSAKEILKEASNIGEVKNSALHYLKYWQEKRGQGR